MVIHINIQLCLEEEKIRHSFEQLPGNGGCCWQKRGRDFLSGGQVTRVYRREQGNSGIRRRSRVYFDICIYICIFCICVFVYLYFYVCYAVVNGGCCWQKQRGPDFLSGGQTPRVYKGIREQGCFRIRRRSRVSTLVSVIENSWPVGHSEFWETHFYQNTAVHWFRSE